METKLEEVGCTKLIKSIQASEQFKKITAKINENNFADVIADLGQMNLSLEPPKVKKAEPEADLAKQDKQPLP